jgi:16S rRNA (uracil1498-N3)-methyltransferase
MSPPRLFSTEALRPASRIVLGDERARYVGRVLRLRAGDLLAVFDGSGGEFAATIAAVTRHELHLDIGQRVERDTESPLQICLVQGLAKGEKMDLVVQKATELGVVRISPVLTAFSVVKLAPERAATRRDHWQKVAQSACEQCGRNKVPSIDAPQSLQNWFGANAGARGTRLILHPAAADALSGIELAGNELTIVIGPEGGFSPAEYASAAAAGLQAVHLGPRIMRTETAAIAALSAAQVAWGDY